MGNDVGRVFEGIATLGISELVRALTPQQQAQVDHSQEIVEQHKQEMERERIKHDQAMQENAAAQEAANEQLQKVMRQLTEAQQNINTTKEELEKATKAKEEEEANVKKLQDLTEGNVKTFNEAQEFHYAQQLKAVEKLPEVGKTPKKSCAFLGKTSTGKSSCINKLFGAQEKTSPLRCTADIKPVKETDTLQVFDVFGENDEESYHNMQTLTVAKRLHVIVVVYTESVDSVLRLARLAKALRVNKVYVRNKSEDLTDEEVALVTEHDTKKIQQVTGESPSVVLTSAKTGMGMNKLKAILEGDPVSVAGRG